MKPTKTTLKRKADGLWSRAIRDRDGRCMAADYWPDIRCAGSLQAMHLIPRMYLSTRWEMWNGAAGCGAHHTFLTHRPLEHAYFCRLILGAKDYERRARAARAAHGSPDYQAIIDRLEAA